MNKASTDQLESDSRPSSGVYSHTQANPHNLIASNKYSLESLCFLTDAKILKYILICGLFLFSPGFYELSDGGSCSLSNSCMSVYSECLSSSQTSLLHPSSPANSHINPLAQVCRQCSAEESTAQPHPTRATGLHLGSSRILANTAGTEQKRPRPVSTGKLMTSHISENNIN